jgi:hypothetical protein
MASGMAVQSRNIMEDSLDLKTVESVIPRKRPTV